MLFHNHFPHFRSLWLTILLWMMTSIGYSTYAQTIPSSWQDTANPFVASPTGSGTSDTTPAQCALSQGGNPFDGAAGGNQCGSSNPAVLDTGTGISQAAGNPINVIYGNKYQREMDMPALPGVLGLELVRHYNSRDSKLDRMPGLMGRGWTLSYEATLSITNGTATIHQADGSPLSFYCSPDSSHCSSSNALQGTLTKTRLAGKEHWKWRWPTGRVLRFDETLRLISIEAPTGESVSMRYDDRNRLQTVTDPQGRMLSLNYPSANDSNKERFVGVMSIDTPVGRFLYTYETADQKKPSADPKTFIANLSQVELPTSYNADTQAHPLANRGTSTSSIRRVYHYEDPTWPTLLTGISVLGIGSDGAPMHQRLSTWTYDDRGRARLSVKGDVNSSLEKVILEFLAANNKTVLTNSLGQKTTYSYAVINSMLRLTEVRGAGCATCGKMNQRYRYDAAGRLLEVIQLDAQGNPLFSTKTRRDQWGRITTITRFAYNHGKPVASKWIRRFEYAQPIAEPTLVATPSVIEGKEHQFHYRYNLLGQLLESSETGWNGSIPLTRTIRYHYNEINGRSVLSAMEEPADPRAKNSPTFHLEWNKKEWGGGDYLQRLISPDGTITTLERNQAGRVIRATLTTGTHREVKEKEYDPLGHILSIKTTRETSDTQGHFQAVPESIESIHFKYNALGQLTERHTKNGENEKPFISHWAWDHAGRLLHQNDATGVEQQYEWNSESRLLALTLHSGKTTQTQRYRYNDQGELISLDRGHGEIEQRRYHPAGWLEHQIDALGHDIQIRYDQWGRPTTHIEAANTPQAGTVQIDYDHADNLKHITAANGATTDFNYDDFGRLVDQQSADSGHDTREYDSENHLLKHHRANGSSVHYRYDANHRLVEQTIIDTQGKNTSTQWKYEADRLTSTQHPHQDEHYAYNSQGQRTTRTVTLKAPSLPLIAPITLTLHYHYNTQHQLDGLTLPDGSYLEYQYNAHKDVTAIRRYRIQTPWLRWLLPPQTLISQIEQDLGGKHAYTLGNGIQVKLQRNESGQLEKSTLNHSSRRIQEHRYTWNRLGMLVEDHTPEKQQHYQYDERDRLKKVDLIAPKPHAFHYEYDANSNRLFADETQPEHSEMLPQSNRLSHSTLHPEPITYDLAGQPIQMNNRRYHWNALGQLASVEEHNKQLAAYAYNANGERLYKTTQGQHTLFLYDQTNLLAELNAEGKIQREYISLDHQPIALIDIPQGAQPALERSALGQVIHDLKTLFTYWFTQPESIRYVHANHLGTPERITDEHAHTLWQADYLPFGQTTIQADKGFSYHQRFPGQYADEETGLYYNYFRYYDPKRGRYLTPDPIGLAGGMNGYGYVEGNPINLIDPYGLRDVIIAVWTSRLVSGSVGHVFVGEMDGTVITSQFPTPHGIEGVNTTKNWVDTLAAEGRSPDYVYKVNVSNDAAFNIAAAKARNAPRWSAFPDGTTSTHCTQAASNAIQAGGISSPSSAWPNWLNSDLLFTSWFGKQVQKLPGVPW